MLQRLVHKADFERLLATRARLRSTHFALHHAAGGPVLPKKPARLQVTRHLSTGAVGKSHKVVENSTAGHWLGCVVPKRHAKRSVTRSLLKRQMRSVFERHVASLPAGSWLLRLSQGFSVADFVSARSTALTQAVRLELDGLCLLMAQQKRQTNLPAQPAVVLPQTLVDGTAGPSAC